MWNRITEQVLFKEEQTNVKQLTLIENSSKFLVVSRPNNPAGVENVRTTATLVMRSIPGREKNFRCFHIYKYSKQKKKYIKKYILYAY